MRKRSRWNLLHWYILLALMEGTGAILWLASLPTEASGGRFSTGRLILLAPGLILFAAFLILLLCLSLRPSLAERWMKIAAAQARKNAWYDTGMAISALIGVVGVYFLAIGAHQQDAYLRAYWQRMASYGLWGTLLAIQSGLALRLLRFGGSFAAFARPSSFASIFRSSLLTLALLLILALSLALTRIGLKPDLIGWGAPGVPILPSQVWLALALSAFILLVLISSRRFPLSLLDALLCILLWAFAFLLWNSQAFLPSYFAPAPTPPNFEFYPYSDAAAYDLSAQRFLLGLGFERDVIRPAYSAFLAIAHAFNGSSLSAVLAWQVPLLAVIPPLLFLLAKSIHHRFSALLLALLVIFRERNALALTGTIDVSNAKMIMSDLPMTLGVILFTLLLTRWLLHPSSRRLLPLLAGAVLAICMLIRTQAIVLLPFAWLAAGLALSQNSGSGEVTRQTRRIRHWLLSNRLLFDSLLLPIGLALAFSPWLVRNYLLTGKVILSDASNVTQAGLIGRRYSASPADENVARLPGETEDEYLARITSGALQFIREHPLQTAGFINAHFWHNQVATLLVLPASAPLMSNLQLTPDDLARWWAKPWLALKKCCSLEAYVRDLPYWHGWDGSLPPESVLPILINLILVSVGIGTAWTRWRFAGLSPLFLNVGYSLSNALARNSGWRYNLPVDWVGLLYYAIGLAQVCFWLKDFITNQPLPDSREKGSNVRISNQQGEMSSRSAGMAIMPFPWKRAGALALSIILFVSILPIAERAIPERYPAGALENALASLGAHTDVQRYLKEEGAVALLGRAFYPRFYPSGEGVPHGGWPAYEPRDYPRLGFYLVGEETTGVILPSEEIPRYFPNAADVLVIGCRRSDYLEARLIFLLSGGNEILQAAPSNDMVCPSP